MPRIKLPTLPEMDQAQRAVYDMVVASRRGRVPQPLLAWLHSPELAVRAQSLGEFVRYRTLLPPRLSELAILVLARIWSSEYEWAVHSKEAVQAGLSEEIIADIAARRRPRGSPDEMLVYEFVLALSTTYAISQELYDQTIQALGEQGTVELVGLLGYYTLISMTVNVFDILPTGPGEPALPK